MITEKTIADMIDNTEPEARRELLLDLALPPVIRALVENLQKYHRLNQLLLRAA